MAKAYILPAGFPGGVAGGFPEVDTTARSLTQTLRLGTRAYDIDGNEYLYVKAEGAIAATDAVAITTTGGLQEVTQSSNSATGTQGFLGVAVAAFTDEQFGFIQIRGLVASVKTGTVVAGTPLAAATTAGTLNALTAAMFTSKHAIAVTADAGGVASVYLP